MAGGSGGGGTQSASVTPGMVDLLQQGTDAQVNAAQTAGTVNAEWLTNAIDNLTKSNWTSQALGANGVVASQGITNPIAQAGYNAFDDYLGTLGQSTPVGGSWAQAQAGQNSAVQRTNMLALMDSVNQSVRSLYEGHYPLSPQVQAGALPGGSGNPSYGNSSGVNGFSNGYSSGQSGNPYASTGGGAPLGTRQYNPNPSGSNAIPQDIVNQLIQTMQAGEQGSPEFKNLYQQSVSQLQQLASQNPGSAQQGLYQNILTNLGSINSLVGQGAATQAAMNPARQTTPQSSVLSKFFNTPAYQLRFGNNGTSNDPSLSVMERFAGSPEASLLGLGMFNPHDNILNNFANSPIAKIFGGYNPNQDNATNFSNSAAAKMFGGYNPGQDIVTNFSNNPLAKIMGGYDPTKDLMGNYQKSPDYDFRMKEGQKALANSAASRGLLQSGTFSKALNTYAQDVANTDFQNYSGKVANTFGNFFSGLNQTYGNYEDGLENAYGNYQNLFGGTLGSYLQDIQGSFGNYQNQLATVAGQGVGITTNYQNQLASVLGSQNPQFNFNAGMQNSNYMKDIGEGFSNSALAQGNAISSGFNNLFSAQQNAQATNLAQQNAQSQNSSGVGSQLGGIAGTLLGGMFGGGGGAAIGGAAGKTLGGLF